jgi:hypothetical protein
MLTCDPLPSEAAPITFMTKIQLVTLRPGARKRW